MPSPTPTMACHDVLYTTTQDLRIMFMVDNSTSTNTTDANKSYRVSTVETFLDTYGVKPNFTYSFAWFAGSVSMIDPTNTTKVVASSTQPFGDSTFLSKALAKYKNVSAASYTEYGKAFNSLKTMISNDMVAGSKWNYAIVFMSDGKPTDGDDESLVESYVTQIKSTVAAKGHLATVSTVYFGPKASTSSDASLAVARLKGMAEKGEGQFLDTNQTGGVLRIDDVISVPGQVCTPQ
jgi:uncharacterized protein YegL